MKLLFTLLTSFALLISMRLKATEASSDPFAVLDPDAGRELVPVTIIQEADYFEFIPEAERKGKTFLVSGVDYHTLKLHESVKHESPFLQNSLNIFSPPGEYVLRTFAFRSYTALQEVTFKISDMTKTSGETITKDNIRLFRIAKVTDNYPNADLLLAPEIKKTEKNTLAFFAVLINVPKIAKPGVYRGKIEISAGNEQQELSISCRVMNISLPTADAAFGSYIPYYPYDIIPVNTGRRRALPCYSSANQENYFKFCRTRGINSQTLCEFDARFKDTENCILDFSELDRQIDILKKTGQDKAVVLDCRSFNDKAENLARQERFRKDKKDALILYENLIGQLFAHAKEHNYPHFLMFVEEEPGNGGVKLKHYDKFSRILQQIAGQEHSIVVDLEVGPGRVNAIDRGSRDGYKYRQYNDWTEEALAKARKEGAVVWSYNYGGFGRPAFGFIQQRIGSHGLHQWADQWEQTWTYNVPTSKGVVSSLRFESTHEGTVDYRYIQELEKIDQKLVSELISSIPVPREDAQAYFYSKSLEEFDLLRWRAAMRLDPSFVQTRVEGKPELRTKEAKNISTVQNKNLSLTATRVNDDYQIDASGHHAYTAGNATGALRYLLNKEKKLRAYSADLEQIKKLLTPSYCESFVNFNNKGLIIFSRVNHMKLNDASARGDNDPDLWKDNCLEFFFRPPNKVKCQLIVNSNGKKVFLRNGSVIEASGIKCVQVANKKDGGTGYLQEILIPWRYFGQTGRPSDNEVWVFNAAREFHTWKQITQWAASDSFHDDSHWGALKFSLQKTGKYLKNTSIPDFCLPGKNVLEGSIPGSYSLQVVLSDEAGKVTAKKTLSATDRNFRFELDISADSRAAKRVSIQDGTKILESEIIPVRNFSSAFSSDKTTLECWSGGTVSFTINANFSQLGIQKDATFLSVLDSNNRTIASFQLVFHNKNKLVCWLKTSGLAPGIYTVVPVLNNDLTRLFEDTCSLKLTVYPTITDYK